jgi:hypothetical protein
MSGVHIIFSTPCRSRENYALTLLAPIYGWYIFFTRRYHVVNDRNAFRRVAGNVLESENMVLRRKYGHCAESVLRLTENISVSTSSIALRSSTQ